MKSCLGGTSLPFWRPRKQNLFECHDLNSLIPIHSASGEVAHLIIISNSQLPSMSDTLFDNSVMVHLILCMNRACRDSANPASTLECRRAVLHLDHAALFSVPIDLPIGTHAAPAVVTRLCKMAKSTCRSEAPQKPPARTPVDGGRLGGPAVPASR